LKQSVDSFSSDYIQVGIKGDIAKLIQESFEKYQMGMSSNSKLIPSQILFCDSINIFLKNEANDLNFDESNFSEYKILSFLHIIGLICNQLEELKEINNFELFLLFLFKDTS